MTDSADSDSVCSALYSQSQRLSHHDEKLNSISQCLCDLAALNKDFHSSLGNQVLLLTEQLHQLSRGPAPEPSAPAPASTGFSSPHLAHPECFTGDSDYCRAFLAQCGLHFELQAPLFPMDRTMVAYVISHLAGRAEAWATAEWHCNSPLCSSLQLFTDTFCKIFENCPHVLIYNMTKQGSQTMQLSFAHLLQKVAGICLPFLMPSFMDFQIKDQLTC